LEKIVYKKVIASLVGISILSLAQAADVTTAMLKNAASSTDSVLSFGIGSEGQRYSPLTQVNTKTVGKLVPAWSFSFGGEKQRGQESQPLIYKGKMTTRPAIR
jgi:alcohol dehydrogenase (cytochrome c)